STSFTLGVFFKCVGDCDGPVTQVLIIHGLNGCIGSLEACKVDKCIAFRVSRVSVSHNLRKKKSTCLKYYSKSTERIIQKFLIHLWIQVTNEDVGTDVLPFGVCRGLMAYLVDPDRLAVELDHVHDFDGVVCILLTHELDKTVALVSLGNAVFGHVDIDWRKEKKKEIGYN
ncbi:hypothetical protein EGW08_004314, partial [Elysia chlorotica]